MRRDKNTIINELVDNAAEVMEAKAEYNELVAEQFEKKGDMERVQRLREINTRIADAVALMRDWAGSWA